MSETQIIHERLGNQGKRIQVTLERRVDRDGDQFVKIRALIDGQAWKYASGHVCEISAHDRERMKIPPEFTHQLDNTVIPADVAVTIAAAQLEIRNFNSGRAAELERLTTNKEIRVIQKENGEMVYTLNCDGNDGYGRHLEPAAIEAVLGNLKQRPSILKGWWYNYPIDQSEYLEIIAW